MIFIFSELNLIPSRNTTFAAMKTRIAPFFCFLILLLFSSFSTVKAQKNEEGVIDEAYERKKAFERQFYTHAELCIYEGDTIPFFQLRNVYIYPPLKFKNNKEWREYMKLVRNVKKVYPLSVMINNIIIETYEYMDDMSKEERLKHIKRVEDGLMDQYKPMFKKLTFSQGKLLIKMVDRQCASPSYDIIKAFVGSFRAKFYQSFAAVFGASLKKRYDKKGEDKLTERVITLVTNYQL